VYRLVLFLGLDVEGNRIAGVIVEDMGDIDGE
jgi:hypothetical protein